MTIVKFVRLLVATGAFLALAGTGFVACRGEGASGNATASASVFTPAITPSSSARPHSSSAQSAVVPSAGPSSSVAGLPPTPPAPPGAYRWVSPDQASAYGRGASDIEISETARGMSFKALTDNAHVPMTMTVGGGDQRFMVDLWPSGVIKIAVDEKFGKTRFAGLTFRRALTLRFVDEGVVVVDTQGVTVTDKSGGAWLAKPSAGPGWFFLVPGRA